ncbi:hypothetical protein [Pseudoalteromonas rubra]|nr:hypothetical protein [Pseudoalteromonas rubra]
MKIIKRVLLTQVAGGVSGDPDRSTLPRMAPIDPPFEKKKKAPYTG